METKQEIFARYKKEYYRARTVRGGKETLTKIIDTVSDVTGMGRKSIIRRFNRLQMKDPLIEDERGRRQWEFDTSDTRNSDFRITPTNIVKTPMMNMNPDKATLRYADTGDLQILELPYKGDKISMLVLLPSENLDAIEFSLTAEKLNEYKLKMKETKLDSISLPKFEFDTKYFMKDTLSALGMPTVFSESADFSGMTGTRDLFIGFVIHQAYVKVDEKGTEAAAATAVGIQTKSVRPRTDFRADHPFIFLIQDKDTGNILFFGRVIDPTK